MFIKIKKIKILNSSKNLFSLPGYTLKPKKKKMEELGGKEKEGKIGGEESTVDILSCHIPTGTSKLRSNRIIDFTSKRFRTLLPTSTGK